MTQTVVLLHGLRTSATMWRYQAERLREAGFRVETPDFPGHGARMDERFTVAESIATIDRAVTTAGGEVFVCGFSLGGYLALHYAGMTRRPITGLLVASCGTQPSRVVLDSWRLAAAVIHRFPDRGLSLNNAAVRLALRDPQRVDDVLAGGVALEVMADALRELRMLRPLVSIRAIEQPVWFVNGQYDHFRLQERSYLRAARSGRLLHVPGATHMVSLARPREFTDILFDALGETA